MTDEADKAYYEVTCHCPKGTPSNREGICKNCGYYSKVNFNLVQAFRKKVMELKHDPRRER